MEKIQQEFIVNQYQSGASNYSRYSREVGLWESEKYVFTTYLRKEDRILDLGCGTGRTTFPLYMGGFRRIIGLDCTPAMIEQAWAMNEQYQTGVVFQIGDATKLEYSNGIFDAVLFSFNGLMSVPGLPNRTKALKEINRVLKPGGLFIFTALDRESDPEWDDFWREQRSLWQRGRQDPRLYNYGDLLVYSEMENREIYFHVPKQKEVNSWLKTNGFEVVESFIRSERFEESERVTHKACDCRFYVARKLL